MKSKTNLLKVLSVVTIVSPIVVSATSCSDYNNFNNNNNNSNIDYPSFDKNDKNDQTSFVSSLPSSIVNVANRNDLNFKYEKSNEYNLNQNYEEFGEDKPLSYSSTQSEMKNDLIYFGYILWKDNSKAFSISDLTVNNLQFSNLDSGKVKLGTSYISFDLEISITNSKINELNILDTKFPLKTGENINKLSIKVSNQLIKSTINTSSNNYFLGWKVSDSEITLNGTTINSIFIPTYESYSNAFQYKFSGLTSKQNYIQLYEKNQESILNLSTSDLKTNIENKYNEEYQKSLDYIDDAIGILGVLKTNPTTANLITGCSQYIANFLVSAGIVPSGLKELILQAFEPGNQAKPFIKVIQENKSLIMDFLETTFGSVATVVEPYLDLLKPGISSSSNEYNNLNSLLDSFNLTQDVKNIIFNDLIGVDNKTPKTLVGILSSNINTIISLLNPSESSNTPMAAIAELLELMFSVNTSTNQNNKFFDIISGSEKTTFYNCLISLLGASNSQISSILSILTESNENFNTNNLVSLVSSLFDLLNVVYQKSSNSNAESYSFLSKDYYRNITFTTGFDKDPVINKKDQTISFKYKISFTINKKIDITPVINSFKKLLSYETISDLIKTLTGTDLDSILKDLGLIKDVVRNKIIDNLLQLIPSKLWIGADSGDTYYKSNSYTSTYAADDSKIWLSPVLYGTNYKLGFQFAYNTNINVDDPSLVNSITSNFNRKTNAAPIFLGINIDIYFYDLWNSILQNVILRDYDYSSIFYSGAVNDNVIATTSTYDPNLYITNLEINDKSSSINQDNLISLLNKAKTTNVLSAYNVGNIWTWKDGNDDKSTYGLKPFLSDDQKKEIINNYISYNSSKINEIFKGTNLEIYSNSNLIFNFELPLKISQSSYNVNVNFNIKVIMMDVINYSPVKFYNTETKKLTNNINQNLFLSQTSQ